MKNARLLKPDCHEDAKFFGIGIENFDTKENIGTLIRSAKQYGASFIFTVGNKYETQRTAVKLDNKIPIFYFKDFKELKDSIQIPIIGIELTDKSEPLAQHNHFSSCIYLLGSESKGLSEDALSGCDAFVLVEGCKSLNVSVAGSIVIYDRYLKLKNCRGRRR